MKNKLVKLLALPITVGMFLVASMALNYASAKSISGENISTEEKTEGLKAVIIEANQDPIKDDTDEMELIKTSEISQKDNEQKLIDLRSQIESYLGDRKDNVGLTLYETSSGKSMDINGDKTFIAASTVKVQMNMVLGDLIVKGQIKPDENLKYTEDCYEEGTGVLQGEDLSNPLPLSLLSEYSIIHSDNIATNMIINRIDYENMRNLIDEKLGHATDHSDNYITSSDETTLLRQLYENKNNNPYYTQVIDYMKNTDFHDRIDYYLPHEIVAHKIGDYDSYVNDAGIVYTSKPYILSIYTNGLDNAEEVIADISKMIYQYENSITN